VTPAICTLALPDALPIFARVLRAIALAALARADEHHAVAVEYYARAEVLAAVVPVIGNENVFQSRQALAVEAGPCQRGGGTGLRSEEHTSELQSRENLVC